MKKKLIEFYLDWVNNYLTSEKMAGDYGITEKEWLSLYHMGKKYHEESVELQKPLK